MNRLLFLIPVAAAAVVYFPICSGYFATDDFLHLYAIVNGNWLEYLLHPHGGHLLSSRNALFMLFHSLFGVRAEPYFGAVLATHLLNVFLLYRVVLRWTDSAALAVLGATLWGTCPVQAGALQWYSVYGQVVVATLLLLILDHAGHIAQRGDEPPRFALLLWPLWLVIASTSFGTGIALTFVSPVVLFLLLPPSRHRWWICAILVALALSIMPSYRALMAWYDQVSGYNQGVVAMQYALAGLKYRGAILAMLGYLMSYGVTNLLLGFASAGSFPGAVSGVVTGIYALATAAAFAIAPARLRRRMLALLIIAAACYGLIAVGRHMYTGAPGVAHAAARARYHYVATIPVAILLCLVADRLTIGLRRRTGVRIALVLFWLATAAVFYARSQPFIELHADARKETLQVLSRIRAAIAAVPPGAEVRIPNQSFRSIGPLLVNARAGFPGWAAVYVIFFPSNVVDGRRVYFTEKDSVVIARAKKGRRTADLIVPAVEKSGQ